MIKHVLFVKLKDSSCESCNEAINVFKGMVGKIDFIKDLQAGVDFLHSARSFDIILELTLDSKEDLERYQNHPYHIENVKSYMHAHRTDSATVDYEF